jgi:hypothetical protein
VAACIKYNVETIARIARDQIVSAKGNEFDLEIGVGEPAPDGRDRWPGVPGNG